MAESTQHKLDRVRSPRVQITYDLETGGAVKEKELPLVVGIMSDLAGKPTTPLPRLKDRKFIQIDPDNFNKVMEGIGPRVAFRVDNKLTDEPDSQLGIELNFKNLEDFEPVNVVEQIEPLRKLLEARRRLSDLISKLDGNDALESILQDVIANEESLKKLKESLGGTENAA